MSEETKARVARVLADMAAKRGLINLTRDDVCREAGIPPGSFPHVMGRTFGEYIADLAAELGPDAEWGGPVERSRSNPELRRRHVLAAALGVAERSGLDGLTVRAVGEAAGVSPSTVCRYYRTAAELLEAVVAEAVRAASPDVVAEAVLAGHVETDTLPKRLKAEIRARFN